MKKNVSFDPLSITDFFNCDKQDHMIKDYSDPLNFTRAASSKLEYYIKRNDTPVYGIHMVLADLCNQLDSGEVQNDEQIDGQEQEPDKQIFENLLASTQGARINFLHGDSSSPNGSHITPSSVPTVPSGCAYIEDKTTLSEEAGPLTTVFDSDDDLDMLQCNSMDREEPPPFHGTFIDTGAQSSVIGRPQALAYCSFGL